MQMEPSIACSCPPAGSLPHGLYMLQQFEPVGRKDQAAPRALEQDNPQLLLKCAHLTAESGLRHPKRLRRRRERAFLRRHQERAGAVPVEIHRTPIHTEMHSE